MDIKSLEKEKLIKNFDLIYHLFMWLLIIINAYFIIKVIVRMRKLATLSNRKSLERAAHQLKWYPIVLFICAFPPTIYRIINLFYEGGNTFMFWFQGIVDSIQGILFVLIYSLNPEVKQAAIQLFRKTFRKL